jgi:hypothetical protein
MEVASRYYDIAYNFAMFTNRSLFLTGKAGTGKTTFLRKLKEQTKKEMAIVAPTGVAAINAGGVTLHSFFQLPFSPFIPSEESRREILGKLKINNVRRKVFSELELLVIDEISMVRADVLDEIDTILRYFRYKKNEPFGGVQVIFIGDMYQLSPVYKEDEWKILSPYYSSMYFFDSQVIRQQSPVYIEFDKIFRQQEMDFIQLLNEVRNNTISDKSYDLLQRLYQPGFKPSKEDSYITLTTHNYIADDINSKELDKLSGRKNKFEAIVKGDYPEKSYPTEKVLEFKVGAKVMFLRNDKENPRRYFNGKIGEITLFDEDIIWVKCPGDKDAIPVEREVWENISYVLNPATKQIEESVLGTFQQYPLRLAWAITIHKSQGLTFDKAIIDVGQAFTPGQVYVALSRCRSLDGMILRSPVNRHSLEVDRNIIEHGKQKLSVETLDLELKHSKREFREKVLFSLFDFKIIAGQTGHLIDFVKEKNSSFNRETIPFLESVQNHIFEIQNVTVRFQNELKQLVSASSVDEEKLQERIAAAIDYFSGQLKIISDKLKQSPAITDSKNNARDYDDDLRTIFALVEEKLHIFKDVKDTFSVEQYYIAKNTLILPPFTVSSFAGSTQSKKSEARFPALYSQLSGLRRKICESSNVPVFMVASTKGLTELATYLPQTLNDMLKISGFGQVTVAKYGQQFLDIVLDYCREKNLGSMMHEIESAKKKASKVERPSKPDTKKVSFDWYKEGFSIDEIAQKRNLAKSTIEGHLMFYVGTGEIPLHNFVSAEKEEKIRQYIEADSKINDIFTSLKGEASYNEIRMVMSLRRKSESK